MRTCSNSTRSDDWKHSWNSTGFSIHLFFFLSHLPLLLVWSHGVLFLSYYFFTLLINNYSNINLLDHSFYTNNSYTFYLPWIYNLYVCVYAQAISSYIVFASYKLFLFFSSYLCVNLRVGLFCEDHFCFFFFFFLVSILTILLSIVF